MKNISSISLLLLCCLAALSLKAQVQFQKTFALNSNSEFFKSISPISNGNFLAMSHVNLSTANAQEAYIAELDAFGNIVREKTFGGNSSAQQFINLLAETDTSYVLYAAHVGLIGSTDLQVVSLSKDFSTVYWNKAVGGSGLEVTENGIRTRDGGYVIMGWTQSYGGGNNHYLFKLSASGSLLWSRHIGGSGTEKIGRVIELPDSSLVVTGLNEFNFSTTHDDIGVYWLNSDGTINHSKTYNVATNDGSYDIARTLDGGLILTGHVYNSNGSSNNDAHLIRLDASGAVLWAKAYGGNNLDMGRRVICLPDSGYIMVGETKSFGAGGYDVLAVRTDKNGSVVWSKSYGGTADDIGYDISPTADGGYHIVGETKSFGAGSNANSYLVKIDANGNSGCNQSSGGSSWSISVSASTLTATNGTGGSTATGGSLASVANTDSLYCGSYGGHKGLTCSDAINLDSLHASTLYEMNDTVMWFKFTALDSLSHYTILADINDTINTIDSIKLFLGSSCLTINPIATFSNEQTLHTNLLTNFRQDSTYFIKIYKGSIATEIIGFKRSTLNWNCAINDTIGLPSPSDCENYGYYLPERTVYINVHFMLKSDGTGNFNETWDGIRNNVHGFYVNGYRVANEMLDWINQTAQANSSNQYVVAGNILPVPTLDSKIKFQLYTDPNDSNDRGIYFHRNDIAYDTLDMTYLKDNFSVHGDKVIDIFYTEALPDTETRNGIAAGIGANICIIDNIYLIYRTNNYDYWTKDVVTYHEIGHCLGLHHTSFCNPPSVDQCADTYDLSTWPDGCFPWNVGNNIMEYHNMQSCITPCQLNIIHSSLPNWLYAGGDECEITGPTDTITGNQYWIVSRYPEGDVFIDSEATLTITCDVFMRSGAKIMVNRGGKLIVDGATITSLCAGKAWSGIEVWGINGSNPQPQPSLDSILSNAYPDSVTDHGVAIIKGGSLISNAYNAVSLFKREGGSANLSYTGGIVLADSSYFRNNGQSIEFMAYPTYQTTNAAYNSVSHIKNCIFETVGNNFAVPYMKHHISLWNINGVEICCNRFGYNKEENPVYIASRGDGIYSVDAGFRARHNVFDSLTYGIRALSTGWSLFKHAEIDSNEFRQTMVGIDITGNGYVLATHNNIAPYNSNGTTPYAFSNGIRNKGNLMYKIEENSIDLPDDFSVGIYNINSSPFPNEVYLNIISGEGDGYGIANSLDNSGVFIKCNDIQNEMDHILVLSDGIREEQGTCQTFFTPANNRFNNSCDYTNSAHVFNNPNTDWFKYTFISSAGGLQPDSLCRSIVNEYNKCANFGTYGISCKSRLANDDDSIGIGFDTTINSGIIEETIAGLAIDISEQYTFLDKGNTSELLANVRDMDMDDKDLLEVLASADGMLSDEVLLDVMYIRPSIDKASYSHLLLQNSPHSNIAWKEIKSFGLPADSLAKLEQYQDSVSERKPIIDSLYYLRYAKMDQYAQLLYLAKKGIAYSYEELQEALAEETEPYLQWLLAELYMGQGMAGEATDVLEAIPVRNREINNLKELRAISLEFQENGWTWGSILHDEEANAYLDEISDIAHRDTSIAAFEAQAILHLLYDSTITEILELKAVPKTAPPMQQENISAPITTGFKVYPNPASDELSIESEKAGSFKVYNVLGVEVLSRQLFSNEKINVSLTGISRGTYLYRFLGTDGHSFSGKIVVME
ncbi:MAG: T9SS type A sorting domain-containing protein [Chitinophagales bacterium]|nr:T9SS type A sorting domain-containing protein [Chitinophagales bacterium]